MIIKINKEFEERRRKQDLVDTATAKRILAITTVIAIVISLPLGMFLDLKGVLAIIVIVYIAAAILMGMVYVVSAYVMMDNYLKKGDK